MVKYTKLRRPRTMEKGEMLRNSNKLTSILNAVKEDHIHSLKETVRFLEILKVEYVELGCGMFYFLSIRVGDLDSEKESIIEKMVWEGTSMEVLELKDKEKNNKEIDSFSNGRNDFEEYRDFAKLVMFEAAPSGCHMKLIRIHHVEENIQRGVYNPTSGFRFKVYTLIIEVEPAYNYLKEENVHIIIEASVLRRDCLQIMDDQNAASFRVWLTDMSEARIHPTSIRRRPASLRYCRHRSFYPIDLCSPHVLTQAWLVLEDHNYKEGTDLEFVKVINGKSSPTTGTNYFLTLQAKEHGVVKTFHIVAREVDFVKCWKPATPLIPCKVDDSYDSYDELYDSWIPSKKIYVNTKRSEPEEEEEFEKSEPEGEAKVEKVEPKRKIRFIPKRIPKRLQLAARY